MIYKVTIERGEDFGYVAHCPAMPGCHGQGGTPEETVENIKDAIYGCAEALGKGLRANSLEILVVKVDV